MRLIIVLVLMLLSLRAGAQDGWQRHRPIILAEPLESYGKHLIYPEVAKQAGLEGKVIVSAIMDTNGQVLTTKIAHSSHFFFDLYAQDAIRRTRFRPAYYRGKPVKVWHKVPVKFRLH